MQLPSSSRGIIKPTRHHIYCNYIARCSARFFSVLRTDFLLLCELYSLQLHHCISSCIGLLLCSPTVLGRFGHVTSSCFKPRHKKRLRPYLSPFVLRSTILTFWCEEVQIPLLVVREEHVHSGHFHCTPTHRRSTSTVAAALPAHIRAVRQYLDMVHAEAAHLRQSQLARASRRIVVVWRGA